MRHGFTLIEMIVAIAIFTMVSLLAIGSLLILTAAERHVSGVQVNQDNIRFAIEKMSREIRTGIEYKSCGANCFQFKNAFGDETQYCLGNDYENAEDPGCTGSGKQILRSVGAGAQPYAITSAPPDVSIEEMNFYHFGTQLSVGKPDALQPRVLIVIKAITQDRSGKKIEMNIETAVSQLNLDI